MKNPPYGVYNVTHPGWCFIHDTFCFRGNLIDAEEYLKLFRKEYPDNKYEIRKHSDECNVVSTSVSKCCKGEKP